MKKILVLGGSGMLGHKLAQRLSADHKTFATLRTNDLPVSVGRALKDVRIVAGVAAEDFPAVRATLDSLNPDVVVNCVGVVKQLADAEDAVKSIEINTLFPHKLAQFCAPKGTRVITLSTDCIFSGRKGNYSEADSPDPVDLYGRSKWLGELDDEKCLTLRTSMIGRQLIGSHGLVEWFLSQGAGIVKGYKKAVFSGFTTNELAGLITLLIDDFPDLQGIWHASASPINKFDLLHLLKDIYKTRTEIVEDEIMQCDRSLNSQCLRQALGLDIVSWPDMIERMKNDLTEYKNFQVATW